jgi:hypothetical protein
MNMEPSDILKALFNSMTSAQRLRLKQAIVQQTIHYVTQNLPPEENEDGQRSFIRAAQSWIDEPTRANEDFANNIVTADLMDGGARNWDYSVYFLLPADAAGADNAIGAAKFVLEAAGSRSEVACQWQIAAAEAILQGHALPALDDA